MLKTLMVSAAIFLLLVVSTLSTNTLIHHIASGQTNQQQTLTSQIPESLQSSLEESSLLSSGLPSSSQLDKTGEKILNQYIVVVKDKSSKTPSQAAGEAKEKGAEVLHVYEHALKGFVIKVQNEKVFEDSIKNNPNIDYIERDTTARAHE